MEEDNRAKQRLESESKPPKERWKLGNYLPPREKTSPRRDFTRKGKRSQFVVCCLGEKAGTCSDQSTDFVTARVLSFPWLMSRRRSCSPVLLVAFGCAARDLRNWWQ
ncbi:hypothetical protein NL676_034095 [Syzygium grande]|nr:hypothetical protein NL676_034095 [Syzygium grande]